METAYIALIISCCSVLVAGTSLGWNVYRDVIRRPKLHISLMTGQVVGSQPLEHRLIVSITNFGPGKTKAQILQLRKTSVLRRLFRKSILAIQLPEQDFYSGELPADLDIGDKVALTFCLREDLFITDPTYDQIGGYDIFGGSHWITRSDYKRARQSYLQQLKKPNKSEQATPRNPSD